MPINKALQTLGGWILRNSEVKVASRYSGALLEKYGRKEIFKDVFDVNKLLPGGEMVSHCPLEARFLVRAQAGQFTNEVSCPGMGEKGAPLANITDVMFAGAGGRPGPAELFGGGGRRAFAEGRIRPEAELQANRPGSFSSAKRIKR